MLQSSVTGHQRPSEPFARANSEVLFAQLYQELRSLARRVRRVDRRAVTLETTALVHETFLKLCGTEASVADQAHFFALAARAMRFVLRDHARAGQRLRRGGDWLRVPFDEAAAFPSVQANELLTLDDAFERLERRDARLARVVEYRFYAGLSLVETAELLKVSTMTVKRDWTKARAFLASALRADEP